MRGVNRPDQSLLDLARDLVDPPEWECPGLSPHPARAQANAERLNWLPEAYGPCRVMSYTCACLATYYEFVSCGGTYMIHRVIQADRAEHAYASGWSPAEGRMWWQRLLSGYAK